MKDGNTAPEMQAAHPSMFDKNVWFEAVLADKNLTQSAKNIAIRLALHHNSTTGRCDPSLPTLAKGVNLSRSVIHTGLTALREAGYIEWTFGKLSRNQYTLKNIVTGQTAPASERGKRPVLRLVPTSNQSGQSDSSQSGQQDSPPVRPTGHKHSNSQPSKGNSVSSEGPSGDSGKQTASGSQQATKAKFTPFPNDFTLTDARIKMATSRGVLTSDVKGVFDHFREHHLAKGTRSPNWPAAWGEWCRVNTKQRKASGPKQSQI